MGVLTSVAVGTGDEGRVIWADGLLVEDNSGGGVGNGVVMVVVSLAHADIEKTSRIKQRGTS